MTIIFATIIALALTEFGNFHIAQGQVNDNTASSSSLTTQQKAAMCSPSDTFVNDTESKICSIHPTLTSTKTGTEASSPSAVPST
jgi:hypothetical protein